jgi:hypothetical protein
VALNDGDTSGLTVAGEGCACHSHLHGFCGRLVGRYPRLRILLWKAVGLSEEVFVDGSGGFVGEKLAAEEAEVGDLLE